MPAFMRILRLDGGVIDCHPTWNEHRPAGVTTHRVVTPKSAWSVPYLDVY